MTIRQALLFALICGTGGAFMPPAHAAAFTCPDTSTVTTTGKTQAIDGLYAGATDADAGKRLGELMTDLRKSGLKPSMIVDHLVGAYCPLVAADTSLSDAQKTNRVRRFAQQVTGLAYMPSETDEVDVLVQTTLAPELLTQIDQAAKRGGVSRDEWITQAIKRQLTAP
ncbi:CopG family transcriptional regulator [Microvirga sp. 2YAF29]|uniref:ribbon-helix-helix domain-containing protein n=1 Tax=Microvirga sp. 2YAF29 TaxID=3233031 RepID=UPI003F9E3618